MVVKLFQKQNPSFVKTKVIMSDKDFNERDHFTKLFPNESLLICLCHILRSFKREVICEKMKINNAQRGRCLAILNAIAYSVSSEQYEKNVRLLGTSRYQNVSIISRLIRSLFQDQWVSSFQDEVLSLGETTNNS